jgi:transcriptional regulator with XRE-family HTH domain
VTFADRAGAVGSRGGSSSAPTATSGIEALDELLGGIFWGDNVVFRTVGDGAAARPFEEAFATAPGFAAKSALRFAAADEPAPGALEVVVVEDADIDAVIERTLQVARGLGPGSLIVIEDLSLLAERGGQEAVRRYFLRICPSLLRLGVVGTWVLGPAVDDATAEEIRRVTQIVIAIEGPGSLVIRKAEARPLDVVGTPLAYTVTSEGVPVVERVGDTARLGGALAAVRVQRGLSQAEIGRLAGVSPSAISQAERGLRGLSVGTLVRLSTALGISLDELVLGQPDPGYRIRGRTAPHRGGASRVALVDGGSADFRLYEFRLDPGAHGAPPGHPRGTELVLLGRGLLLVTLTDGATAVIREGEALIGAGAGIAEWRNLDEDQALGFWVLV